jgi:hypothetical protein
VQCWNEATKIRSISGLPPARQVVVGWVDQPRACAVTETREVWCWELAWTKDPKVSAHKLDVAKPVVQVVAGSGNLCALTDSGEVLCWGALGACTGSLRTTRGRDPPAQIATSSPSPRQLAFPSPIETLYAGQSIVCGQSSAGDVYCQGCRASGEVLATPKLLPMSVARCR